MTADLAEPVLEVLQPEAQLVPLVVASPHSGRCYPAEFVADSALDPLTLRRSEDSYVDELFAAAPRFGAPLLRALFPRAYLDVNRDAYELDPAMFEGKLPDFVRTDTPRVAAGLGTVPRQVAGDAPIYRRKLSFAEVEKRIETLYRPYHKTLSDLVEQTMARFSRCILLDCHSMPSIGGPDDSDSGNERVDFVLGDCHGRTCGPALIDTLEAILGGSGYRVVRNTPYAGGYTTCHYGDPGQSRQALQIEINRRLYMNERSHQKHAGFAKLQVNITRMIERVASMLAEGKLT